MVIVVLLPVVTAVGGTFTGSSEKLEEQIRYETAVEVVKTIAESGMFEE